MSPSFLRSGGWTGLSNSGKGFASLLPVQLQGAEGRISCSQQVALKRAEGSSPWAHLMKDLRVKRLRSCFGSFACSLSSGMETLKEVQKGGDGAWSVSDTVPCLVLTSGMPQPFKAEVR